MARPRFPQARFHRPTRWGLASGGRWRTALGHEGRRRLECEIAFDQDTETARTDQKQIRTLTHEVRDEKSAPARHNENTFNRIDNVDWSFVVLLGEQVTCREKLAV